MNSLFETLGNALNPKPADEVFETAPNKYACDCVDIEIGSYDNQVVLPRPPHMPSTRGVDTICVDACLKDEILHLWSIGITTTGCCCGHNKLEPFIGVDDKDIQRMKDMGYIVHPNNCRPGDEDQFYPKSLEAKTLKF